MDTHSAATATATCGGVVTALGTEGTLAGIPRTGCTTGITDGGAKNTEAGATELTTTVGFGDAKFGRVGTVAATTVATGEIDGGGTATAAAETVAGG